MDAADMFGHSQARMNLSREAQEQVQGMLTRKDEKAIKMTCRPRALSWNDFYGEIDCGFTRPYRRRENESRVYKRLERGARYVAVFSHLGHLLFA
jgi:hypothetical protein